MHQNEVSTTHKGMYGVLHETTEIRKEMQLKHKHSKMKVKKKKKIISVTIRVKKQLLTDTHL